ncbi:MAG: aminoacyl-tRNA hydrolase [Actinomycetota bacterium]|nr:aminoacyl-tRNA hydrolase [Actinomycetota bacterium]
MVGLGNPGRSYEGTRHNVGAEAVLLLAARRGLSLKRERGTTSIVTKLPLDACVMVVAIPQTWMNECGIAVRALVDRHLSAREDDDDTLLHRLVVVHDELDLPPGQVKVKVAGGTAGHNGLKSIRSHLHSSEFARVRVGVGKPPNPARGASYVLARPPGREREALELAKQDAADAVEVVMSEGLAAAMTRFNSTKHQPR